MSECLISKKLSQICNLFDISVEKRKVQDLFNIPLIKNQHKLKNLKKYQYL